MKRVEIVFDEANENEILMILRQARVEHYTRFSAVTGTGSSGAKLGNAVGPGLNSMVLAIVPDEAAPRVVEAVRRFKNVVKQEGGQSGTRCIVSPVEEMI